MEVWIIIVVACAVLVYVWFTLWYCYGMVEEGNAGAKENFADIVENTNKCWGCLNVIIWILLMPIMLLALLLMILSVVLKAVLLCVSCGKIPWNDEAIIRVLDRTVGALSCWRCCNLFRICCKWDCEAGVTCPGGTTDERRPNESAPDADAFRAPSYDDVMQQGVTNLSFQGSTISVIGEQGAPPTYEEALKMQVIQRHRGNTERITDVAAAAQPADFEISCPGRHSPACSERSQEESTDNGGQSIAATSVTVGTCSEGCTHSQTSICTIPSPVGEGDGEQMHVASDVTRPSSDSDAARNDSQYSSDRSISQVERY